MALKPLFLWPSLLFNLLSISVCDFGARQTAVVNTDLLDAVLEKHRSKDVPLCSSDMKYHSSFLILLATSFFCDLSLFSNIQ